RKQEDVRGRLHDAEADDEVDEVAAGDDAVEADEEEPRRERVREEAHRAAITSSRNSWKIRTRAAATSRADAAFRIGIVPPEASVPVVPSRMTLSRNAAPAISAATPTATYAPAPVPSATSTRARGLAAR